MTKWEYNIIDLHSYKNKGPIEVLDILGEKGWELCNVAIERDDLGRYVAFMKRRK